MDRIGREIERELDRFTPDRTMQALVTAWPEAVGAQVARHAWPARLGRDGTLSVSTSSSAWAFELTQLAGVVRERLGEILGEGAPRRIAFAPGRLPAPAAREEPRPEAQPRVPSPSEAAEGLRIAAPIGDEELRSTVARAAAASLAQAADDRAV